MKIKKSITLSSRLSNKIRKWPSRIDDPGNFSAKLEEILSDFIILFERAQKNMQSFFEQNEMNFFYDVFNGHIFNLYLNLKQTFLYEVEDAELLYSLSQKWGIDMGKLRQKLESLSEFEIYVLSKMIDEFWHNQAKQG